MGARRTVLKLAVSRSGAAGVFSTFDMGALMLSRVITVTLIWLSVFFFFFQAEDGIRDRNVTGVQTCALPIFFAKKSAGDSIEAEATTNDSGGLKEESRHGPHGVVHAARERFSGASTEPQKPMSGSSDKGSE